MQTTPLQYSVVVFVVLALIVSVFYGEKMQKSNRKHMIAACFILGAALIHAAMLVLELRP